MGGLRRPGHAQGGQRRPNAVVDREGAPEAAAAREGTCRADFFERRVDCHRACALPAPVILLRRDGEGCPR